jgi:hypothetical protein
MSEEILKCYRCKQNKNYLQFISTNGKKLKSCNECNNKFKCTYEDCEKTFCNNYKLNRHVSSVHENIKSIYCEVEGCSYTCGEISTLKRHKKLYMIIYVI